MGKLNLSNHPGCPPIKTIWNRDYAARRLSAELERLDREPSHCFAVVVVEVAGFAGNLAGRLGYATSKDVLPKVLALLTDNLGPEGICTRLGEEEFLLILSGCSAEKANLFADVLRRRWDAESTSADSTSVDVTVAAAAWEARRGASVQAVFAVVDQALDEEKERMTPTRGALEVAPGLSRRWGTALVGNT